MRQVVLLVAVAVAFSLRSAEARRFVCVDGGVSMRKSVATRGDCDVDRQPDGVCTFASSGKLNGSPIVVPLGARRRQRKVVELNGQPTVFVCRRRPDTSAERSRTERLSELTGTTRYSFGQGPAAALRLRFETAVPGAPPPYATKIEHLRVRCAPLHAPGSPRCRRQAGEGFGIIIAEGDDLFAHLTVSMKDGATCTFEGPSDVDFTRASGSFTCANGRRRRGCCAGTGDFVLDTFRESGSKVDIAASSG